MHKYLFIPYINEAEVQNTMTYFHVTSTVLIHMIQ